MVVLRVADPHRVVGHETQFLERGREATRLVDPEGRIITAPLLKMTCSSSPSSAMSASAVASCGCHVATITRPRATGPATRARSAS